MSGLRGIAMLLRKKITQTTKEDAEERIKELLNQHPSLKQIVEEQGWEGLELLSNDPVVQELLEWHECLSK
ncbi:hypothetical protein [Desulfurobacterium sp.]